MLYYFFLLFCNSKFENLWITTIIIILIIVLVYTDGLKINVSLIHCGITWIVV